MRSQLNGAMHVALLVVDRNVSARYIMRNVKVLVAQCIVAGSSPRFWKRGGTRWPLSAIGQFALNLSRVAFRRNIRFRRSQFSQNALLPAADMFCHHVLVEETPCPNVR